MLKWTITGIGKRESQIDSNKGTVVFHEKEENTYVELEYKIPFAVTGEEYIFFPACCYDGNRFDVLKKMYPPLFTPEEGKIDMPVTITDVPRLEKDGSGTIEVTTGDVSVPCVGVYSKEQKKAVLFYTIQQIDGINLGLSYSKGSISVSYPHMKKEAMYQWPFMKPSEDKGITFESGKKIEIPYRIVEFECENMEEFYHQFFITRKCMGMDDKLPEVLDRKKQFDIQKEKMNQYNWKPEGEFYGTEIAEKGQTWQAGWIGGGMYTYPLMRLGGRLEWERAVKTLRHLFKQQSESGFFYEASDEKGNPLKGIQGNDWSKNEWHVARKSADLLYYLCMHLNLMRERNYDIPELFETGTKKVADAFVRLWKKYGQFGQFVSLTTGDILVGGSTSAVIASAGLAEAAIYFGEESYMDIARESADYYCKKVMEDGYSTGGPGEILQCPDSESAFGLLESAVTLYRLTKEEKWLRYGRYLAEFCSSWVVSYNYKFPEESEFAKLDMKTTGCVFANVQNKHAAPGICTLSGFSIYQLYQWTGEEKYYELFREITDSVSQYMSTEDRPIYTWDVPKDATLLKPEDKQTVEKEKQAPGFMCERVNMSDWETERCIGGIFPGSCCWCETANLMILADYNKYFGQNHEQVTNF